MALGLTDGQIQINKKTLSVVPGSVERRYGRGEINVNTQSMGNGNIDTVHNVNLETAKSYFKCSLRVIGINISDVDEWKINIGENLINYFAGDLIETYEKMSMVNDPTFPDSNDGVIEVEFEGNPLVK